MLTKGILKLLRSLAEGVIGRVHVVHARRNGAVPENVLDGERVAAIFLLGEESSAGMPEAMRVDISPNRRLADAPHQLVNLMITQTEEGIRWNIS